MAENAEFAKQTVFPKIPLNGISNELREYLVSLELTLKEALKGSEYTNIILQRDYEGV